MRRPCGLRTAGRRFVALRRNGRRRAARPVRGGRRAVPSRAASLSARLELRRASTACHRVDGRSSRPLAPRRTNPRTRSFGEASAQRIPADSRRRRGRCPRRHPRRRVGGPDGGSRPADGRRRNRGGRSTRHGAQRLPRLCDPDQQARRRRLAPAGGGAAVTGWFAPRAEDLLLLGLTGAGLGLFIGPLLLGSGFPQPVALFSALVAVSALVVLGVAVQTHRLSTRLLAVLAALVAIDATLRLVIVIGLLGFSPIFFLIIAGGYVMGPSFGFASGALTLLLSALLTAALAPWLPYQMLAAGWVGMGAGYLGRMTRRSTSPGAIAVLCLYGCAAGFVYGLLLDLWEWPLLVAAGSSPLSWVPGIGLAAQLRRFGGFYLATSLAYDSFRAAGNLVLIAILGPAVIRALDRFRRRFLLYWAEPGPVPEPAPGKISADVGTPA